MGVFLSGIIVSLVCAAGANAGSPVAKAPLPSFANVNGTIVPVASKPSGAALKTTDLPADRAPTMSSTPDHNNTYWKKTFADEFKGRAGAPSAAYASKCFDIEPTCIGDDKFANYDHNFLGQVACTGTSAINVAGDGTETINLSALPHYSAHNLDNLDKCIWKVHRSSTQAEGHLNLHDPAEVEVRPDIDNGVLILKARSYMPDGTSPAHHTSRTIKVLKEGEWFDEIIDTSLDTMRSYNCATPTGDPVTELSRLKCPIHSGKIASRPDQKAPAKPGVPNGFSQRSGLFQVRGKLSHGPGAWPAFWMVSDGYWPWAGELDLMEAGFDGWESGNSYTFTQTFHSGSKAYSSFADPSYGGLLNLHISKGSSLSNSGALTPVGNSLTENYHNYSVEYDDLGKFVAFRVDGVITNAVQNGETSMDATIMGSPNADPAFPPSLVGTTIPGQRAPTPLFDHEAIENSGWDLQSFWMRLENKINTGPNSGPPPNAPTDPLDFTEQDLYVDYFRAWQKCDLTKPSDVCPQGGTFDGRNTCSGTAIAAYRSPCTRCIYGGDDSYPNCRVGPKFNQPELNPGISYWVDPDIRWPGLYYHQLDGGCTAGGSVAAPNCKLREYRTAANDLPTPGIYFWVDGNPGYPGIYYKQAAGTTSADEVKKRCPAGGTVSGDGNCQWMTQAQLQSKGLLAGGQYFRNFGVNFYEVATDPRWPGIYYHQVGGFWGVGGSCPYGGVLDTNSKCHLMRFSYPQGDVPAILPGETYWVDTHPAYPGVYYKQADPSSTASIFKCPMGGTVSGGGNCQLAGFNHPVQPYLVYGRTYMPTGDLRWPGLYYYQVHNDPLGNVCPYGGTVSGNDHCQLFALAPGVLEDQIKYSVDTDPRWPGIYYLQMH